MNEPTGEGAARNVSDLADIFAEVGHDLIVQSSIDGVLEIISTRAFELIPAAEHAAISRGRRGRFETVASSSELPPLIDKIQYELHSGPCVDAVLEDTVYRVDDLTTSQKWAEFGRLAAERYGIYSMLSVRMFLEDDDLLAGLNLYSSARGAFDESDQTTATLLATHGALAFTSARRQDKIENLERALATSRRIGMAVGVVMTSHKVTDEQAFDLLRIASQSSHRKLYDIAEDVILTGMLDVPLPPRRRLRDHSG